MGVDLAKLGVMTMAEVQAMRARQPNPKAGLPTPIAKIERQKTKDAKGKTFRDEVWARDGGKCRATKKPLLRTGSTDWQKLGEVDHALQRSTNPDRIYDTSNGLLLMKLLNRLRKVACKHAPEFKRFDYSGPENRALPQVFIWRDENGKITRRTEG